MAGTPVEEFVEWLLREEETLGIHRVTRATMDIEELKELLSKELGYEPVEAQLMGFMEAAKVKYEYLPEVGVEVKPIVMPWGIQYQYKDMLTGQVAKTIAVTEVIRRALPPLPFRGR